MTQSTIRWNDLAEASLAGQLLSESDGLAILRSPDSELLELLAAAYRVRHHVFGNRVHLNYLINAKSGLCGEDCGYCSQSRFAKSQIPTYDLLHEEHVLAGANLAVERDAGTYCIVTSGRQPSKNDFASILRMVPEVKKAHSSLRLCVSPGLLTAAQARQLREAGVDRVNHNLNTSERFYSRICTTHTYQDRLATLQAIRDAGMEICCGGIVGLGEEDVDVVEMARRMGQIKPEAVPINFLIPIAGTPCEGVQRLNPRYCLKVLALFRLANPRCELRIAAGREIHLGPLQPLGLFAANSIFIGDYLTTKGQAPEEDYRMIEALGFEPILEATGGPGD